MALWYILSTGSLKDIRVWGRNKNDLALGRELLSKVLRKHSVESLGRLFEYRREADPDNSSHNYIGVTLPTLKELGYKVKGG